MARKRTRRLRESKITEASTVQTVVFDKNLWSRERARQWLADHDFRSDKVDEPEDGETLRFRQIDPAQCRRGSFQTLTESFPEGVNVVTCDVQNRESHRTTLLPDARILEAADENGTEYDVMIIEKGVSQNGFEYTPDFLRQHAHMFEGVQAAAYKYGRDFYDHIPDAVRDKAKGGPLQNVVGWFNNVRYGSAKIDGQEHEGLLARFHIAENASWLRSLMRDAIRKGAHILGFSIDGDSMAVETVSSGRRVVRPVKMNRVDEVTVVSRPAAGGRVLRLVASIGAEVRMQLKKLLEAIRKTFPKWLEGFETTNVPEEAMPDLVKQIVEKNKARAVEAMAQVRESAALAPVAKGVQTLQQLDEMLKDEKFDEAKNLIDDWAKAAKKAEPKPEARHYSYPEPKAEKKDESASAPDAQPQDEPVTDKKSDPVMSNENKELKEAQARLQKLENDTVLGTELAKSNLPEPAQKRVRALFDGKTATSEKVQEAISEEKDYAASLTGSPSFPGGTRKDVAVGEEKVDRYRKAMQGMLQGRKIENVRPFTGLHESYRVVEGYMGSRPDMARRIMICMAAANPAVPGHEEELEEHHKQLKESLSVQQYRVKEALQTTTWAEVFGDSIRRALIAIAQQPMFEEWRRIVSSIVPLQDFRTNRRVRVGGFADLSTVGELGTYSALANPGDEEETYSAQKRGNLYEVSFEAIANDDLGAVRRVPQQLGIAAGRTLAKFVLKTNLSDNPTVVSDSTVLVTSGHNNATTSALDATALDEVITLMRKQTELSSSERINIVPKILVVPPDLQKTAWELLNSQVKIGASNEEPNIFNNLYGLELLINPWQTDTNDWFLVADPMMHPTIEMGFLGGREEPELFIQDAANLGSVLTADKITWKIRHIYGGVPLDFRSFGGGIVA